MVVGGDLGRGNGRPAVDGYWGLGGWVTKADRPGLAGLGDGGSVEEGHRIGIALRFLPEWTKVVFLDCIVEANVVACGGRMVVAARDRG